ncbi:hypothetical protein J3R82DRAFT_2577 [Butyriboletus roseoflavus]|nr:hypothetical protein J3R82DRAFT_2577 [Butyriboletus roseoflavus]
MSFMMSTTLTVKSPIIHIVASTGPGTSKHSACVLPKTIHIPTNLLPVAVLAVQNMEASGAVSKAQEIEFMALGGSLVMMSKGWFSYEPFISPD